MDSTVKNILIVLFVIVIFFLLKELAVILLPLALAFLFALVFQPLIQGMKKLKMPSFLVLPVVFIVAFGFLFLVYFIISNTVSSILYQQDYIAQRINHRIVDLIKVYNDITGGSLRQRKVFREINDLPNTDWFKAAITDIAGRIGAFTSSFVMFALYFIVLVSGMTNYKKYIRYVGGTENSSFEANYETLQKSINKYMLLKTLINIGIGAIVSLICLAFGVQFPFLWGFLAFLVYYIPSIGSILATILPILMCIIQNDSFEYVGLFALCLMGVLFIIGNIIEPKITGNTMRLNTLTIIFGLVFWGYIWGIPGMMMSVPLMVIIKLFFERFPSLSMIARLMSYPDETKA